MAEIPYRRRDVRLHCTQCGVSGRRGGRAGFVERVCHSPRGSSTSGQGGYTPHQPDKDQPERRDSQEPLRIHSVRIDPGARPD